MAALRTGDVTAEGIELNYIAIDSPREIFDRMGSRQEFDVAEFSSSEFISTLACGDCPLLALPVFPSRVYRHSHIYINRRSGIKVPKDLEHKRVGVALYTQTAAVWIRGHLAHQYGVDLSTIRWVEGAVEKSGRHGNPSAPPLLEPAAIERNGSGRSLSELLARGEIDALAGARHLWPHPDVVPIFRDAAAEERAFYRETGIFVSVKLQDLFGVVDTPRIGPRKIAITFELLAPNGRPVQVTSDLRSFWARGYPEVRKALRARYPKHCWPETP